MIWAFVSPTFRQNLKQLKNRNNLTDLREARGDKFVMNFIQRYKSIVRLKKKAIADKQTVLEVLDDAYPWNVIADFINAISDPALLKTKKKKGIAKFLR